MVITNNIITGYTKEDALDKLYGKISIIDSKKG